jgi:hypothetical protein
LVTASQQLIEPVAMHGKQSESFVQLEGQVPGPPLSGAAASTPVPGGTELPDAEELEIADVVPPLVPLAGKLTLPPETLDADPDAVVVAAPSARLPSGP